MAFFFAVFCGRDTEQRFRTSYAAVRTVDSVDRLWTDHVFAAHVHSQRFWDANGTVIVQVVFQECDEHTWRSNYGVVQGVSEVVFAFAFDADTQSASLTPSSSSINTGSSLSSPK